MPEPQNEIDPTIAANSDGISTFSGNPATSSGRDEVVAVLDPGDQRHRATADAVEQRDHLRYRRHPDVQRGRDPDRRTQHQTERDQPGR